MLEWWNSLEIFLKVLYCIAIPASVILVLQTILLIIGIGGDTDVDISSDTGGIDFDGGADIGDVSDAVDLGEVSTADGGSGDFGIMQLFTVQGVIAFLCVLGWSAIIARGMGVYTWACIVIGLVLGFGAMFGVSKIIRLSAKLASNGAVNYENAVGQNGTAYIIIPAGGLKRGKVNLTLQGRLIEADAVTYGEIDIPTGAPVKITEAKGDLLVCVVAKAEQ